MKLLFIFIVVPLFNACYFKIFGKRIVFKKYVTKFFITTIIIFIISIIFNLNPDKEMFLIYMPIYFFLFLSFLLTIGLKFMNSPSEEISNIVIKYKKIKKKDLIKKMLLKKIILKRIYDLRKQNLIRVNNNKLELTSYGKNVASIFRAIQVQFKIKNNG